LQQQNGLLTDYATRFIDGPLMAVMLFSVALAVAAALVWRVPRIRRTLAEVERGRTTAIDGLRGLLGISVFIHHTVITWFLLQGKGWNLPPSRLIVHLGQTSVALFFMITAFLFWSRVLTRGGNIDWVEFFVSRLYRLYPVYLLMLGLLLVVVFALSWAPSWSGRPVIAGPIVQPLLQWLMFTMFSTPDLNGVPQTGFLIAMVTWSLRYEWLFYLALPLLGFLAGRSRQPVAAMLSAIAVVAIYYAFQWKDAFDVWILQSFLGGIVAAHWVRNPLLVRIGRAPASGLVAVAALAAVVTLLPTAFAWEATLGVTLFFVVVASGHDLWRFLRLPGLLWLGDITYSIYLLHGLMLAVVFQCLLPRAVAGRWPVFLAAAVAIDVVLVLAGSIIFLRLERPAILIGRRHCRRLENWGAAALRRGWSPAFRTSPQDAAGAGDHLALELKSGGTENLDRRVR
jgi:peptidoglycan/LPS O-acetylase OafA/YrhL